MRLAHIAVQGAREILNAIGHTVYPPHCLLTGEYMADAVQRVPGISDTALEFHAPAPCQQDLMLLLQRHFLADDLSLSAVHALWAIGTGSTIDNAIYAVKYKGQRQLAKNMGACLASHPELENLSKEAVILGVPIHSARFRERGYNQAELIAGGWAQCANLQLLPSTSVVRQRYTPTQTSQNEKQRLKNVDGAFRVLDPSMVSGRHIILVDDVLTTGATLNACATALLAAGALRVEAATLCAAV